MACLEPMVEPTYETGEADNIHHLLLKLRDFAVGLGWAVNKEINYHGNEYEPDIFIDDSGQAGVIGPNTVPWTTDTGPNNGEFTIADNVITIDDKAINYYRIQQNLGMVPGVYYEVVYEVLSRIAGTLSTYFGSTSVHNATTVGLHHAYGTQGTGEFLRFYSNDFRGTIKVHSVRQINASSQLYLHHPDAGYFNFKTHAQEYFPITSNPPPYLDVRGSREFDPAKDVDEQLGTSPVCRSNALYSPFFSYHFFGTTKYINCVIETWQGEFTHFGFGNVDKYYDFRGGQYVNGMNWQMGNGYQNDSSHARHDYPIGFEMGHHYYNASYSYLQADLLGTTDQDRWLQGNDYTRNNDTLYYTKKGFNAQEYWDNPYYGTAPFMPVHLAGNNVSGYRFSLGEMPGYRKCSMRYLIPKDKVLIGGEYWMVFPVKRKQIKTPEEYISNSGSFGIALFHSYAV